MKINVFADTICGWCFIGHKNLNKALKNFPNIKFDIRHIPFQLNPDMPAEGIPRDKYLEIKFGGKDYAAPMYENMRLKAKESGMNFNLNKINKTPNTVLSHLLIILSEQFNLGNEIKGKIYQSYFIDGLDIGNLDILIEIAKQNNIPEKEFKDFINATGYTTSAEQYGWSFVQKDVYDYEIVNGANWLMPDGINPSLDSLPITQVSYNDAIEYCKWAGVSLPTYEQYWELVSSDDRLIVSDNMYPISSVESVNIIGNVWDITEPINSDQIRLAGGSLFCSIDTCHGTQEDRELYVDKETGNIHIGFSILTE